METITTSEYNVLVSLFKNAENQLACSYSSTTSLSGNKIEDIYFFEVNTKYISSRVLKISVILRVRTAL